MQREVIAVVKLAPGEGGYYDEYSRIYLTQSDPVAQVFSGTNCIQLKRSVKSGRLLLVRGTLSPELDSNIIIPIQTPVQQQAPVQQVEFNQQSQNSNLQQEPAAEQVHNEQQELEQQANEKQDEQTPETQETEESETQEENVEQGSVEVKAKGRVKKSKE